MKRALFLFNHDAPHQVAHLAGVADSTAKLYPEIACEIAYATPHLRQRIESLIDTGTSERIFWRELTLPPGAARMAQIGDRILPASRLLRLRHNIDAFAAADIVLSTERTCLRTKRLLPPTDVPLYVKIPHGAGDRSVAYHPDYRRFDCAFVAGQKVVDQLVSHGVARERIRIIGYPKFETVDLTARPDFFGNGRPTFLYNPHFDPHLSSWYDTGPNLLRWFASPAGQRFNLIFAPHVMLFRKRWHVSLEYRTARRRPGIPKEAFDAQNVLVDVEGPNLFDMTYTLAADAYIGDVSSQVYEFLARPRPTFFLDMRKKRQGADDEWHHFWNAGPVARSLENLLPILGTYQDIGDNFADAQRDLFAYTFDQSDVPPSDRAAHAIAEMLGLGS